MRSHKRTLKTIQQMVPIVARALEAGVAVKIAWHALVAEGYLPNQADVMLRWAEQTNKHKGRKIP